jgi:hypothetical protein
MLDVPLLGIHGCQIMLGSLHIVDVAQVAHDQLADAFAALTEIKGDLVVTNSLGMTVLDVFPRLHTVRDIVLAQNDNLVDARIPSLQNMRSLVQYGNSVLCQDYVSALPNNQSLPVGCGTVAIDQYMLYDAPSTLSAVDVASIVQDSVKQAFGLTDDVLSVTALPAFYQIPNMLHMQLLDVMPHARYDFSVADLSATTSLLYQQLASSGISLSKFGEQRLSPSTVTWRGELELIGEWSMQCICSYAVRRMFGARFIRMYVRIVLPCVHAMFIVLLCMFIQENTVQTDH